MSGSRYQLSFDKLLSRLMKDESKYHLGSLQRDFSGDLSFEDLISSAVSRFRKWSKLDQFVKLIEMRVKCKDNDFAEALRKEGNSYYLKSDLNMALMKFNESIKFSPHLSMEDVSDKMQNFSYQDLPFAYANRAAVLLEMGLYDEACTDIRRAVNLGYSRSKQKLSVRYCKSLIYIHLKKNPQSPITSSVFDAVFEKSEADLGFTIDDDQRNQITEYKFDVKIAAINKSKSPKNIEVPKPVLDGEHPQIPGLSNKVEFAARVKRGRYFIAGEDIYPGTVLAIDPGFIAATLNPEYVGEYCSACSKPCKFIFVPCHQCTSVAFCNEQCRDEAFKSYHRYECSVLPLIGSLQSEPTSFMALRIIVSLGYSKLHEYVKIFEREEEAKKPSIAKRGFSSEGVYDSKSYRSVYYLTDHKEKRDSTDLFQISCLAVLMTFFLKKYTTFFNEENLSSKKSVNNLNFDEREMLIAKLMLRHLLSLSVNAITNTDCEESSWNVKAIGGDIKCLFYIFGHSCNPNACVADSSTVRSFAIIPKGTEICICYISPFIGTSKQERQVQLMKHFYFTCDCIACVEDWQIDVGSIRNFLSYLRIKCMFGCKDGTLSYSSARCTKCSKGLKKEISLYSKTYLKRINRIVYGSSSENLKSIERDKSLTTENVFTELDKQTESFFLTQVSGYFSKSNPLEITKEETYNAFKVIYLFDKYSDCPSSVTLFFTRDYLKMFYNFSSNGVSFK